MGAKVLHGITVLGELCDDGILQTYAAMVGADGEGSRKVWGSGGAHEDVWLGGDELENEKIECKDEGNEWCRREMKRRGKAPVGPDPPGLIPLLTTSAGLRVGVFIFPGLLDVGEDAGQHRFQMLQGLTILGKVSAKGVAQVTPTQVIIRREF